MAHKHVIPLLDALETEHAFLAVMPYAEKGSLCAEGRGAAGRATNSRKRVGLFGRLFIRLCQGVASSIRNARRNAAASRGHGSLDAAA